MTKVKDMAKKGEAVYLEAEHLETWNKLQEMEQKIKEDSLAINKNELIIKQHKDKLFGEMVEHNKFTNDILGSYEFKYSKKIKQIDSDGQIHFVEETE